MDFWDWLEYGVEKGFCSDSDCLTHNGVPHTDEENDEFDEGGDPCVPAVRLYWPD